MDELSKEQEVLNDQLNEERAQDEADGATMDEAKEEYEKWAGMWTGAKEDMPDFTEWLSEMNNKYRDD